jgi:hypothetical protein
MQAIALGLMLGAALPLLAAADVRPTVVELFTSEGCNSCPPSEALIGTLAKSRSDVIALAFHVDYWDYIGWRDRFEIPQAAQRQREYAKSLNLASVYTPQLVIDGHHDQVGSNDASAIVTAKNPQSCALEIAVHADQLLVNVGASNTKAAARTADDVVLVSYLAEGSSKVTRGENAGHELHEFNIVRSVKILGGWYGDAQSFSVPLKSLPGDATHVAVLVQTNGAGAITAAASHALR